MFLPVDGQGSLFTTSFISCISPCLRVLQGTLDSSLSLSVKELLFLLRLCYPLCKWFQLPSFETSFSCGHLTPHSFKVHLLWLLLLLYWLSCFSCSQVHPAHTSQSSNTFSACLLLSTPEIALCAALQIHGLVLTFSSSVSTWGRLLLHSSSWISIISSVPSSFIFPGL